MDSQAELILRVITPWFLVLSQFFRDGICLFKFNRSILSSISTAVSNSILDSYSLRPEKKTLVLVKFQHAGVDADAEVAIWSCQVLGVKC